MVLLEIVCNMSNIEFPIPSGLALYHDRNSDGNPVQRAIFLHSLFNFTTNSKATVGLLLVVKRRSIRGAISVSRRLLQTIDLHPYSPVSYMMVESSAFL